MRLSTRQDIETPIDFVYAQLVDFDQFERMAMRRGAEVERAGGGPGDGPGLSWRVRFVFRGKARNVIITFAEAVPGQALGFTFAGDAFEGTLRLDLLALSPRRTRVTVVTEVKPRNFAARLVLQSARLARARIERRFSAAVAKFALVLQDRWQTPPRR